MGAQRGTNQTDGNRILCALTGDIGGRKGAAVVCLSMMRLDPWCPVMLRGFATLPPENQLKRFKEPHTIKRCAPLEDDVSGTAKFLCDNRQCLGLAVLANELLMPCLRLWVAA